MSMLGIALTDFQERAVRRLIGCLDEAVSCYQFSGGFAMRRLDASQLRPSMNRV